MLRPSIFYSFLGAAVVCALCTPLVRRLALHVGAIDYPDKRKVHGEPMPRLGGVGVVASILLGCLIATLIDADLSRAVVAAGARIPIFVTALLLLLTLGVIDDIEPVAAAYKFFVETAAAFAIIQWVFPITSIDLVIVRIPESAFPLPQILGAFWIVGVTNAFNMIDGLDGLASGVGAIAAAALAFTSAPVTGVVPAMILAAAAGSLTGFLLHNGHPARIFLGDSGTLAVGFLLGSLSIAALSTGGTWSAFPAVFALAVPLLDLGVAVLRRGLKGVQIVHPASEVAGYSFHWHGVPVFFSPDARHIHHRLLSLGLSPRRAVLALYACESLVGVLAVASMQWRQLAPYLLLLTFVVFAYIASRWFYEELWIFRRGMLLPFFESSIARSRTAHIAFDVVALGVSYAAAALITGTHVSDAVPRAALAAGATAAVFWTAKIYAASLRYAGVWELLGMARALLYGVAAAAIADAVFFNLPGFGLGAWVLFGYFALTITVGARLSFRILDSAYQHGRERGERVLIIGAGRAGAIVLRELLANADAAMQPVGFIDDDARLWDRRIEGYPIHRGGLPVLGAILKQTGATTVLISAIGSLSAQQRVDLEHMCTTSNCAILEFRMSMEPVEPAVLEAPSLIRLK